MMGPTHAVIGMSSWLGLLAVNEAAHTPMLVTTAIAIGGMVIAGVSALEPDIDTKNSLASHMLGPVTGALSFGIRHAFGGHRKITHSIIGTVIIALLAFGVTKSVHAPLWIPDAIMTGWISHIAADMLTREGCPLLWPIGKKRYGLHLVTTGLGKKKGKHTSEYWIIRPLAIISLIGFGIMLAMGV